MHASRRVAIVCLTPWNGSSERHIFDFGAQRVQASLLASGLEDVDVHFLSAQIAEGEVDDLSARLEALAPDVVGAAVYVWSFPSMLDVVDRVKARRPKTTVILGGPSARPAMFSLPPFRGRQASVDALVLGEGEEVFPAIVGLASRDAGSLKALPGLALPEGTGWHRTPEAPSIEALDALASPYAQGLVSNEVSPLLETFRGCPLACSFCEWGAVGDGRRTFSRDSLVRELNAIKKQGFRRPVQLTDAALNLNARAFRNLRDAEAETHTLREIGFDYMVYPSHVTDEHIDFIAGLPHGRAGLGLQSFDREVLKRMNRTFDEKRFERVAHRLSEVGSKVEIEIIVGLPGDSPSSFLRTLDRVRKLPCAVRVYPCMVLPDALMTRATPDMELTFNPETLMMRSCQGWTEHDVRQTWEYLDRYSEPAWMTARSPITADASGYGTSAMSWVFRPEEAPRSELRRRPEASSPPIELVSPQPPPNQEARFRTDQLPSAMGDLSAWVSSATRGVWKVVHGEVQRDHLFLRLLSDRGQVTVEGADAIEAPFEDQFLIVGAVALRCTGSDTLDDRVLAGIGSRVAPLMLPRLDPAVATESKPSLVTLSTGR
jgi:hypothetical protein